MPAERSLTVVPAARVAHDAPPQRDIALERVAIAATTVSAELVRENLPAHVLQRQLRHSNMGVTTTYLASIDQDEIVTALHERRPPMLAVADLQDVLRVR